MWIFQKFVDFAKTPTVLNSAKEKKKSCCQVFGKIFDFFVPVKGLKAFRKRELIFCVYLNLNPIADPEPGFKTGSTGT